MKNAISINPFRGHVTVGGLVILTPQMQDADIAPLLPFLSARFSPAIYNFAGLSFEGRPASAQLTFDAGRLMTVTWGVLMPDGPASIDAVTDADTQAEIAFVRVGLFRQIGYPQGADEMRFPWGVVYCCVDPKTKLSASGLRWGRSA